jgi:predicted ArsR family transcriptional regulator
MAPSQSNLRRQLHESIEKQWFWIQEHIQRSDPTASASDVADRIVDRLATQIEQVIGPTELDAAVRNTAKLICYENWRTLSRRNRRQVVVSETVELLDPGSLQFATAMELQSDLDFIRRRLSPEQLDLIESIYGFGDKEPLTVAQLAANLTMKEVTLRQKLHRLYKRLKAEYRLRGTLGC